MPDDASDRGGPEKRVDEEWKDEVRREKEKVEAKVEETRRERRERDARQGPPPPDFMHFVSGIAAQTLMQLGELENPIEGRTVVDLGSARYSIDILQMLEEKTAGNLTEDEKRYLAAALHDLRMRFVAAASGGPKGTGEASPEEGPAPSGEGGA